jgi:hypothetical protein
LVIRRDRHASYCWGRHIDNSSGRDNFIVSHRTMSALMLELRRIEIDKLGRPRLAPCCDRPTAALVYKGKKIPYDDGSPRSRAGTTALRRAEAILNHIIAQRR